MLSLQSKVAPLSPLQSLINKGNNLHNLSSFFSPKSNHHRTPSKPLIKHISKPSLNSSNSHQLNANEAIQSHPQPPNSSFTHLFSVLVKNKNYPQAIYCYKRFASSGLPSNFYTLNVLLNCYCNLKMGSGCGFSVFGVILKSGYCPNTITLTSLVKGLCLEERVGDASGLFRKMIQLGCYPNVVTCATLISGLCKAGNAAAALELHREMLDGEAAVGWSCDPTVVSYGSLIGGVCKAGLLIKARELLIEMRGRGIAPNVVVYTSLIDRLCWSGKWDDARLLYLEMTGHGVEPNAMTLNVILNGLCKQGKRLKVKELELMAQSGSVADVVYTFFMEGQERVGR